MKCLDNILFFDAEQEGSGKLFFNEKFVAINDAFNEAEITEKINGIDLIALPGLLDPHVHFRTPGMAHKEDFKTGGEAALAGGVTCVFDMPNTLPAVLNNQILNDKRKIINALSPIHFGLFICGNDKNIEALKSAKNIPGIKLFLNDTTGHLLLENRDAWKAIFQLGKQVTLHAEGATFLEAIAIWEKAGMPCRIHLAHMTLKKECDEIIRLKNNPKAKLLISCEVCPHHLFFHEGDLAQHPFLRMKPELASDADRLALWASIENNDIDCFATDHAPHLITEKKTNNPAFGVPGVETMLPLLFTVWKQKKWDMKKLAAMTSHNAYKIYGVKNKKGLFKIGYDADFTIFDPYNAFFIKASELHSKCAWTPFENHTVFGKIHATFINGQMLYDGQNFYPNTLTNKEISFH